MSDEITNFIFSELAMTNPTTPAPEGEASEKLSRLAVFQILHEHLSQSRPMTPWERKVAAEALWSEFEPDEPPDQSLSKGTTETPETDAFVQSRSRDEIIALSRALERRLTKAMEEANRWNRDCAVVEHDLAALQRENEKLLEDAGACSMANAILHKRLATKDAQIAELREIITEHEVNNKKMLTSITQLNESMDRVLKKIQR